MTTEEIRAVIGKVKFLDFQIDVEVSHIMKTVLDPSAELTFHIRHWGPNNETRRGRSLMTFISVQRVCPVDEGEILASCYRAFMEKLRHEASEIFEYDGKRVFNEHFGPDMTARFPMISEMVKTEEVKTTIRGFKIIEFQDARGNECNIQKSSAAMEDRIWIGSKEIDLMHFKAGQGWKQVDLIHTEEEHYVANNRMELNQEQVRAILPALQKFAQTGDL
jgi:hypothetical protein